MKFDEYLAQYLYEKKSLHLQSIGTFELDKSVSLPQQSEKEVHYPVEGLAYTYNQKDITNEDLIQYLIKRLGKIEPLVRSDLDSYLSNIRQFINIGKPYTIEGIGTLHSNNQGTYEFTPGHFLPFRADAGPRKDKNDHYTRNEYARNEPTKSSGRRGVAITFIVIAVLAILAAAGWAAYEFLIKPRQQNSANNEAIIEPVADTLGKDTVAANFADTTHVQNLSSTNDSIDYKMVFETTGLRARALTRTAFLKSGGTRARVDSIVSGNSSSYRMYVPFRLRNSDTLRVKDSLKKFFNRTITIIH